MWKKGPMPPGTWNWGGIATKESLKDHGFYFADFKGDHVIVNPGTSEAKRVEAADILWYNNSLDLPPRW